MDFKELLFKQYRWDSLVCRHMIGKLTDDLTEDELNWQYAPGHHSIWHNLWHMFLSNDYYIADALGTPPVWEEGDWANRMDLTSMSRAFDYPGNAEDGPCPRFLIADVPDSLVDELKAIPLPSYLAYVDDMIERTTERIKLASDETLLMRREWYGGPKRRAYAQLTYAHAYRHIGMMEDLRGIIRGPGTGTASI